MIVLAIYIHFLSIFEKQEWNARILIERSQAVTCPSVNFHLAGTKKIQQELSKPGVLEKYLTDEVAIAKIRSTFVHQYDLGLVSTTTSLSKVICRTP